ncbi:hypothetical protein AC249_AIPGENE29247 [Exaiptasia diaphana]|nr:hypothetical protein AC249_AIPGENE29247 [Exaiptasia diaphana]
MPTLLPIASPLPHFTSAVSDSNWSSENSTSSDNITVVSAYFNLGTFQKGSAEKRGENKYKDWMKRLAQVQNSMVIYLENNETKNYLKTIRSGSLGSLTQFVEVNRGDLWAFGLQENISKIYANPNYPKHHPNTVLPEYSCAMHAKFEVMSHAVRNNFFKTKYFIWLDVGCFRDRRVDDKPFYLVRPPGFDPSRIAYTEMFSFDPKQTPRNIVLKNIVWVSGAFFVGRGDVMLRWVDQYKRQVHSLLKEGLMNTDQQTIYSMFTDKRNNNSVQIQAYRARGNYPWFTLGYLCIEREKYS